MTQSTTARRWLLAGTAALVSLTTCGPALLAHAPVDGPPAPSPSAAAPTAPPAADRSQGVKLDLSRAWVLGASVSDGFGVRVSVPAPDPAVNPGATAPGAGDATGQPAAKPAPARPRSAAVSLADVLAAIADAPKGAPRADTSSMFFLDAQATGKRQIEAAGKAQPTMVFALDYLFWYLYGVMPEADRLKLLEEGLANLAALTCPVVVGDIPDMSAAIGGMLSRAQVPEAATMAAANQRLAAWAAGRKNVVVLPLSELVRGAMSGARVDLGGRTFEGASARALVQGDRLHATLDGTIAVALDGLNRLRTAGLLDKAAAWSNDPDVIRQRVMERKKPAPRPTAEPAAAPAR